jgi:aldose 1-epimerase
MGVLRGGKHGGTGAVGKRFGTSFDSRVPHDGIRQPGWTLTRHRCRPSLHGMAQIHELTCGDAMLRLAPALGGRITALRLARDGVARPVLLPFPEDATDLLHWPKGGLYPLLPYGNRIRNARLAGHVLRPHPDAAPHSLHGPAHREPWMLGSATATSATLHLDRAADEEWPWRIACWLRFDLPAPDRARIAIGLRNADATPMPAGLGLHPYLPHARDAEVRVVAPVDWPVAPDGLAGAPRAAPDLSGPLPRGTVTCYRSGWDGNAFAALPAGGRLEVARLSGPLDHIVLHRPGDAPYLCLEPTSHVADAFNRTSEPGSGARILAPGEALEAAVELRLLA